MHGGSRIHKSDVTIGTDKVEAVFNAKPAVAASLDHSKVWNGRLQQQQNSCDGGITQSRL